MFLVQFLSFFFVYRWVFPEWILALGFAEIFDDTYIFEPDRFQIYRAFWEEVFNVFCFVSVITLFLFSCTRNKFFAFWQDSPATTLLVACLLAWIRLGQRVLNFYLVFFLFFVFNFVSFMLRLNAYLNAFKYKLFY